MKVGVYQGGFARGISENLQLMQKCASEAKSKGCDLIVFCETFLHGYCSGNDLTTLSELQNGPSFQFASQVASSLGIGIVYGYSEMSPEDSNIRYNSSIFIGKDGKMLGNYRKTHLWGDYEKSFFTPGNSFLEPFEFEGLKVSMLICFDIEFPEPARMLALQGVQLLVVPTALVGYDMTTITVPSRALENHIFIAYANRCGKDVYATDGRESVFCGNSVIVGPHGLDLARAGHEESSLIIAEIDPTKELWKEEERKNPYLTSRRSDLYKL